MIKTVADLLKAFCDKEREVLDGENVRHAPTIGAMYEGLTREMLDKAIPEELNLRVVEGFACFGDKQSGQIDCMLVLGDGARIPKTHYYKWPVENILAVFEVKKTLTANDLADSYDHLREASALYSNYVSSCRGTVGPTRYKMEVPARIFAQITGVVPPSHEHVSVLPFELQMIYHALVVEYVSPIRIVVGHHGWKKEITLRENFFKLIERRLNRPQGMGVASFPQLIIGGECSLVKANGFPYVTSLTGGTWPFFVSTACNPIRLMLELIFSKIDFMFGTNLAHDNDLEQEVLNPFLRAKAIKSGDRVGWGYTYDFIDHKSLTQRKNTFLWRPVELSLAQSEILHALCYGEEVDISAEHFRLVAESEAGAVSDFINGLIRTQLVALDGAILRLTTQECAIVLAPDGKIYAAENNTGQLSTWAASTFAQEQS